MYGFIGVVDYELGTDALPRSGGSWLLCAMIYVPNKGGGLGYQPKCTGPTA